VVGTAAGPVEALLPPGVIDGVEPRMDPVPALGEHTAQVLRQLGITPVSSSEENTSWI
jgi:formyl-CoA transferase